MKVEWDWKNLEQALVALVRRFAACITRSSSEAPSKTIADIIITPPSMP
jgi:hypothetical protein